MEKRVLITGSSGAIGKSLCQGLMAKSYKIFTPSHKELDLTKASEVKAYFKHKHFDIIIHAAIKPEKRNIPPCADFLAANLAMFDNICAMRKHYGFLLNMGSGAIYDKARDNRKVKEEDLKPPSSGNRTSIFKYMLHERIAKLEGFYDFNIFGCFGKYEDWQIRFISNAICKTLFNLPITLRQDRIFSYLWAEDLARLMDYFINLLLAGKKPIYKFYNLTPDSELSLKEAALIISEIAFKKTGKMPLLKIAKPALGLAYSGDNLRLHEQISGLSFTPHAKAISQLYNWYAENKSKIDMRLLLTDK